MEGGNEMHQLDLWHQRQMGFQGSLPPPGESRQASVQLPLPPQITSLYDPSCSRDVPVPRGFRTNFFLRTPESLRRIHDTYKNRSWKYISERASRLSTKPDHLNFLFDLLVFFPIHAHCSLSVGLALIYHFLLPLYPRDI